PPRAVSPLSLHDALPISLELRPSLGVQAHAPGQLVRVVEARERRGLRGRAQVEGAPHLADRGRDRGGRDAVADAQAGEAEDLRRSEEYTSELQSPDHLVC